MTKPEPVDELRALVAGLTPDRARQVVQAWTEAQRMTEPQWHEVGQLLQQLEEEN